MGRAGKVYITRASNQFQEYYLITLQDLRHDGIDWWIMHQIRNEDRGKKEKRKENQKEGGGEKQDQKNKTIEMRKNK